MSMEASVEPRQRIITADEFYDLFAGRDFELVDGIVVTRGTGQPLEWWYPEIAGRLGLDSEHAPMTAPEHGKLEVRLSYALTAYLLDHPVAEAYANTGFILRRQPDLTRGPDLAVVRRESIAAKPPPERGFWEIGPELVMEIVSPDDRADDVNQKVRDYLDAGVLLVWLIYPRQKQVNVYRSGGDVRLLLGAGELDGEDILPGFRLPLERLWE
jgi:Uma2 family endonuclease